MASIKHKGFKWTVGDASNPTLALCVDETSLALHVCSAADAGTDWAVSADGDPSVYIHCDGTNVATDYVKIYHNDTDACIDGVGAATISLLVAGTETVSIAASGVIDLVTQSLTSVNASGSTDMTTWLAALGAGADGSDDEDPKYAMAINVAGTTAYIPCFASI